MGSPVGGADPIPTDAHCRPRRQHERMMDPMEDEEASEPQGRLPTPHAPVPIRATAPALRQQGVQRVHPNRPAPPTHHHDDGVRGTATLLETQCKGASLRPSQGGHQRWMCPPARGATAIRCTNLPSRLGLLPTPSHMVHSVGGGGWGGRVSCASGCACATTAPGCSHASEIEWCYLFIQV